MTNFFRKIPKPLVVLVLVLAVLPGHAFASEGDSFPPPSDVTSSVPTYSPPDTQDSPPDTQDSPPDTQDSPLDDANGSDGDDDSGSVYYPSYSGYDTFTVSGADVTVNVEKHDTLSVASAAPDTPEASNRFVSPQAEAETPTLAETIRSLFGSYTPRTQMVTTYYDGQPISMDEQIVPGLAGLDYEWFAGVGMFALITFCLFRLLGGILKNG